MSRKSKKTPVKDLLYDYEELQKESKVIVMCAPTVEQIVLARRRVRLCAVYITNGLWPEIERPPSLYVVCDKTGSNFYSVPTTEVVSQSAFPEHPWEEPVPIVIKRCTDMFDAHIDKHKKQEDGRLLYYPKSGEVWSDKLLFNWKEKYDKRKDNEIREALKGKTMFARDTKNDSGYIRYIYRNALEAWENQRAFLHGEL